MTSLDISSVRDFTKTRLRRMLLDFYFLSIYPYGPSDANLIDLDTNCEKLIELTNKNLFKNLDAKEHFNFTKQHYERPKAVIYVKILNTNKFTKKVGDFLIEFGIFSNDSSNKKGDKPQSKSDTSQRPSSKMLKKCKSKNELKRLKVNSTIFKPKTTKDQMKVTRFGLDKIRRLERKIKYGFQRTNYSEQIRNNLKEVFQHQNNPSIICKTSNSLSNLPPNWNYCKAYELEMDKIMDPSDLVLKIDIRLLEFMDISPKQSIIDLLTDQFLDVVIIKDLRAFYFQMIESISNQYGHQKYSTSYLENALNNDTLTPDQLLNDKLECSYQDSKENDKSMSASEEKISINSKNLKIIKKPKSSNFLIKLNFLRNLFQADNHLKQNAESDDRYKAQNDLKSKASIINLKSKQIKLDHIEKDLKIKDDKLNSLKNDSSAKSPDLRCLKWISSLNLFKSYKDQSLKSKKTTTNRIDKGEKRRKKKFENTAFLSIELQLGAKIETSKEKRLIKCLNHVEMYTVLALDGKKSFLNLRELKSQSSWRCIYTPFHIFILNQSKMHSTINSLEDAICRTIAIAKMYAKYARIKNFCHLNSSINDLLYQINLNSRQTWYTELNQMLEDYLFENLEQIFKAEMPASLITMYKYNYSKYGEFLFDNQVQLILGVIAIKSSLQLDLIRIEDIENIFSNPDSDDETFKRKKKKKKKSQFAIQAQEISTSSISETAAYASYVKRNRILPTSEAYSNAGLNLLGSMAKGFERCAQVWMQYMESKKPENNLEDLVYFSKALKSFCTGLERVFQRQKYLLVKRLLIEQKKAKLDNNKNLDQIAKKYLASPRLPRFVLQSLMNLHLIIDSRISNWIPFSLKVLIDDLMILPLNYDDATDVAKRNAIFQASPYKDIYNSLRVAIEKLQSLHNEPVQTQVTVETIQGWFPLNVTQAWVSEEIQRVELECANWDEFFKELVFIKSDLKIDKMEKLSLMTDKEKQIKEKEFQEFINGWITKRLDDIVTVSANELTESIYKNELFSNKINYLTKARSEILKPKESISKTSLFDGVKRLESFKSLLNESNTLIDKQINDNKKIELLNLNAKDKTALFNDEQQVTKNEEKFKEPADKIKHELDKLIKSQSIASQLADKLIMNDDRKEKTVQNVLEAMKRESESGQNKSKQELDLKLEDKLKEELEKIKLEKELEDEKKRKELEAKIKEEFDSFKQAKSDRFNKRLQKFSNLKPIQLIKLMESCYENLIAFVKWPHPMFPARTAKEIVYCIDLIAVCLKTFYQKLEQKSRSKFEIIYKKSLERFIAIIQTVNKVLMNNTFVDPDLRMNVVEWTEYQEKSWRGVVVSLECSKQINKFCILNETKTNRKLRVPRRKLMVNRKNLKNEGGN